MTTTEKTEVALINMTDTMAEVALKPLTRHTARLLNDLAQDVQSRAAKALERTAGPVKNRCGAR